MLKHTLHINQYTHFTTINCGAILKDHTNDNSTLFKNLKMRLAPCFSMVNLGTNKQIISLLQQTLCNKLKSDTESALERTPGIFEFIFHATLNCGAILKNHLCKLKT